MRIGRLNLDFDLFVVGGCYIILGNVKYNIKEIVCYSSS